MSNAGVEFGDHGGIALGVSLGHGAVGEVAAVGCLQFVVHVESTQRLNSAAPSSERTCAETGSPFSNARTTAVVRPP